MHANTVQNSFSETIYLQRTSRYTTFCKPSKSPGTPSPKSRRRSRPKSPGTPTGCAFRGTLTSSGGLDLYAAYCCVSGADCELLRSAQGCSSRKSPGTNNFWPPFTNEMSAQVSHTKWKSPGTISSWYNAVDSRILLWGPHAI